MDATNNRRNAFIRAVLVSAIAIVSTLCWIMGSECAMADPLLADPLQPEDLVASETSMPAWLKASLTAGAGIEAAAALQWRMVEGMVHDAPTDGAALQGAPADGLSSIAKTDGVTSGHIAGSPDRWIVSEVSRQDTGHGRWPRSCRGLRE